MRTKWRPVIQLDGNSYMFPVASFVYPVFVNLDLLKEAGVTRLCRRPGPSSSKPLRKLTDPSKNQYGWVLPLNLQAPNGVQNDLMSWVWASGNSMMKDGKPDLSQR